MDAENTIRSLRRQIQKLQLTVRDQHVALDESLGRYRALFEGSGEGLLVVDVKTRAFRFANPALCRFLGYTREELTAMTVADLHPEEDISWIMEEFQQQAQGNKLLAAQIPCLRKDSKVVYADIRTSHIEMDGRHCMVGFFADITRHLEVKAELSQQVSFLQTLIDTLPNPIFYKDAQARYLGCNKAFEEFIGMTKEELVGKSVHEISPKDLEDVYQAADDALFRTRDKQIYEALVRYADGTRRPVIFYKAVFFRERGSLGGLVGAMVDITARKQAEEERAMLATAIEQSPELIFITDLHGSIHYVNPAFEQISGYARSEVIGKTPTVLQSGMHPKDYYAEMWRVLGSGRQWTGRLINRRKDGRLFHVEATIVPVRKNGKISDYLAVQRDVTQELLREKQLRQSQKMEAMGTLAGGIAHDFNNILSAIVGYTDIALYDLQDDDPLADYLKKVLKAGERASSLVNQILDFSRSSEKKVRPVVVRILVKEVLKLLRATLPSTITVRRQIDSNATVLADPTQIHQVILNLCTNAAYAMQAQGGELSISLTDADIGPGEFAHGAALEPGAYLRLTVADTGTGIAPEDIERIYDPFFTTKKPGEGTGMGLAVVHGIVQECSGRIDVHSVLSQGSRFEVLLPIIEIEPGDKHSADEDLAMGSEHILLVDDEPDIVDVGRKMLKLLGYRVTTAMDGQEALDLFLNQPDDFDLVVTDMTMPNLTGEMLGQRLLAVRRNIPVIICTGHSEKLTEESVRSMGFAGIAYKPLNISDIARIIRQAMDAVG